jgi:hypothetical protein
MGVTLGIPDSLITYIIQSSVGTSTISYALQGDYSHTTTANGDLTLYESNLQTLYPDLYLLYTGPNIIGKCYNYIRYLYRYVFLRTIKNIENIFQISLGNFGLLSLELYKHFLFLILWEKSYFINFVVSKLKNCICTCFYNNES